MSYNSLPKDLKNLITGFGWQITAKQLHDNLQTLSEIKKWQLHIVFLKKNVWCRRSRMYTYSPLTVFRPISWFGTRFSGWRILFDWIVVQEFLHRLDFRKRIVFRTGTRKQWLLKITDWRNVLLVDSFWKTLLRVSQDPFKPTYKEERFTGIKWLWD